MNAIRAITQAPGQATAAGASIPGCAQPRAIRGVLQALTSRASGVTITLPESVP